jgi:hypothetical protein
MRFLIQNNHLSQAEKMCLGQVQRRKTLRLAAKNPKWHHTLKGLPSVPMSPDEKILIIRSLRCVLRK